MSLESEPYVCPHCSKEVQPDDDFCSRKTSPLSMGSPDYTLFRASGEYDGHIINEFKLMVPLQEVLPAEEKLRELEFLK